MRSRGGDDEKQKRLEDLKYRPMHDRFLRLKKSAYTYGACRR